MWKESIKAPWKARARSVRRKYPCFLRGFYATPYNGSGFWAGGRSCLGGGVARLRLSPVHKTGGFQSRRASRRVAAVAAWFLRRSPHYPAPRMARRSPFPATDGGTDGKAAQTSRVDERHKARGGRRAVFAAVAREPSKSSRSASLSIIVIQIIGRKAVFFPFDNFDYRK